MNKEFNLIKTTKTIKKLNKKLFLLKYFEQKIWQIHKLSTFLFCFLILLNGLSASLSAIEKSKLANELKKKISTINLSSISDEEELTQELLSLFDYDSSEGEENNYFKEEEGNEILDIQFSKDLEEEGEENNENNAQVLLQLLDVIDEEGIEIEKEFNKTKNEKEENKILKNNEGKEGEGKEFNLINSTIINSNNLFNLTTKKEEKEEIKNILNSTNLINKEIKIEETTINLTKNNDEINFNQKTTENNLINNNQQTIFTTTNSVSSPTSTITTSEQTILPTTQLINVVNTTIKSELNNLTTTTKIITSQLFPTFNLTNNSENSTTKPTTIEQQDISLFNSTKENKLFFEITTTSIPLNNLTIKEEENNITTKQIIEENNNLLINDNESKEFLEMKLIKKEELNLAILKLDKQIHENGDLNNINFEELQKYKENLKRIITTIDTALNTMENNENNLVEEKEGENSLNKNKLIKQLIKDNFKIKSAISSSLPNWRSKYLLNRINSFNKNVEENIRKSPLQLTNKTTTTTLIPQTNNSEENITIKTTSTINTTTIISLLNQTFIENIGENISITTTEKEENTPQFDILNDSLTTSTSSSTSNSKPNILLQSNKLFIPKIIIQNSIKNLTSSILDQCKHLSQPELVEELKRKGTYNPELMAWDVSGVFRFLDRSIVDQYEKQIKTQKSGEQAIKRNIEALEKLLGELKLHCNIRTPEALSRFGNITLANPKHSIISPSMRGGYWEEGEENIMMTRQKRNTIFAQNLFNSSSSERRKRSDFKNKKQLKSQIGDVHIVPFGCDKRGYSEDGYLRLCSACQAIRKLPGDFFPPFINEVVCNEDKACLYFYEYPHGKCKQKYMNFVVLRNVGTPLCQVWEKFNLNVRVSCECFVDEMSFFAKYV